MLALETKDARMERLALLALSLMKGIGYWTLYRLKQDGLSLWEVIRRTDGPNVLTELKKRGARIPEHSLDWNDAAERSLENAYRLEAELARDGIRVLMRGEPGYPHGLDDLEDPPHWLFVWGSVDILSSPSIAAVGTRKPTEDGEWLCRYVGMNLSGWGAPTVSGLASGMDQLVHEYSLRMRVPTIAVLGTGIRTEYPKGSSALARRMIEAGGAVVTEYLPNDIYSAENFVRRNRIQAGLSRILIPVEWAQKSGTAHTVNYAGKLRRPIAGLRLPDWPASRVSIHYQNSKVFCVPLEQQAFCDFVDSTLKTTSSKVGEQLSFL